MTAAGLACAATLQRVPLAVIVTLLVAMVANWLGLPRVARALQVVAAGLLLALTILLALTPAR